MPRSVINIFVREVSLSTTYLTAGQSEAVLRAAGQNSLLATLSLTGLNLSQVPADLLANTVAGVRYEWNNKGLTASRIFVRLAGFAPLSPPKEYISHQLRRLFPDCITLWVNRQTGS